MIIELIGVLGVFSGFFPSVGGLLWDEEENNVADVFAIGGAVWGVSGIRIDFRVCQHV